jgi:hypothetical protein
VQWNIPCYRSEKLFKFLLWSTRELVMEGHKIWTDPSCTKGVESVVVEFVRLIKSEIGVTSRDIDL